MDDVVPSVLQRLRAADIIRMAGLSAASLGQEYARIGAVHSTKRQGARLSGVVDVPGASHSDAASTEINAEGAEQADARADTRDRPLRCMVEVEIRGGNTWSIACSCHATTTICQHAAALLYQWLTHPLSFVYAVFDTPLLSSQNGFVVSSEEDTPLMGTVQAAEPRGGASSLPKQAQRLRQVGRPGMQRATALVVNLVEILNQVGLSELRGIAREYDLPTTSASKAQLIEAIRDVLKQPEAVRRVASSLDKPLRQLLATITLASGSVIDEDLSGLFERFSLGHLNQLQPMLATLQNKGLLFRSSLHSAIRQPTGISRSMVDVGWYIPPEVRAALRVTVPVTVFDVKDEDGTIAIQQIEPYSLLSDLLLAARALDGYRLQPDDEIEERATHRSPDPFVPARTPGTYSADGSGAIVPPAGIPGSTMLLLLQAEVPRTPALLRFAVRLLRLADILHKDDAGTPYLRVLPNAAQLLLGPARTEVIQDLFDLWLTSASYKELYDLQEEDLRLRCRATPLQHPVLRPGELEAENSEARQWLVALLAQAPLNQWISFPAFARFVYRLNPTFLQHRQRLFASPHWWLEQEDGRVLQPMQFNDWLQAEGRYLARLVRGPLHWWGASNLAIAGDGRLLAFRLTPLAGLLLGNNPFEQPEIVRVDHSMLPLLEVLESGELLVSCRAEAWPFIELLEDFAAVAGVRAGRLCYRLSPQLLSEAFSQGKHPAALLRWLREFQEHEDQPAGSLARMVEQLEQWTTQYGRARLYTGVTLVEVADTLVMRELNATTSIEEQVVKALSPTLLLLKKAGSERVIEDLKRRGQTPLLHDEVDYGAE